MDGLGLVPIAGGDALLTIRDVTRTICRRDVLGGASRQGDIGTMKSALPRAGGRFDCSLLAE
jgi:hypothetical protein